MKGRRKFSKEFKVEAVRLSEQRGARAASESLGIDISLIYHWKKALESEGSEAFRGNGNRPLEIDLLFCGRSPCLCFFLYFVPAEALAATDCWEHLF